MLDPAERSQLEYYVAVRNGGPRSFSASEFIFQTNMDLVQAGRLVVAERREVEHSVFWAMNITEMGLKALAVDEVIRKVRP